MNVSVRTTSRRGMCAPGSNPVTSAAICDGSPVGSNFVIRPTALTPCVICLQKASTPIPAGATTPRPVTTTRLIDILHCALARYTSRGSSEPGPPQLQDPVPCQEALDERRVEDTIAHQLDVRRSDRHPSQVRQRFPDVGEFLDDIDVGNGEVQTTVDSQRDQHLEEHGQAEVSLARVLEPSLDRE